MKSEQKVKVGFYTRSNRKSKGASSIMLRVSLNGLRGSFGQTGLSVEPSDLVKSRVISSNPNAARLNGELEKLESKIAFLVDHLNGKGRPT